MLVETQAYQSMRNKILCPTQKVVKPLDQERRLIWSYSNLQPWFSHRRTAQHVEIVVIFRIRSNSFMLPSKIGRPVRDFIYLWKERGKTIGFSRLEPMKLRIQKSIAGQEHQRQQAHWWVHEVEDRRAMSLGYQPPTTTAQAVSIPQWLLKWWGCTRLGLDAIALSSSLSDEDVAKLHSFASDQTIELDCRLCLPAINVYLPTGCV